MNKRAILPLLFIPFILGGCKGNTSEETSTSVTSNQQDSSISLNTQKVSLQVGETYQLTASIKIEGALVFWSSKDTKIATVSSDGLVTAVASGQTIIYAKCGTDTAMCAVTVTKESVDYALSLVLPKTTYTLELGQTFNLPITAKLGNEIVTPTYTYEYSDNTIVSIQGLVVTPQVVGTTEVLVTATYQEQTANEVLTITVI